MKKVFIEYKQCTGCKSCELACAVEHSSSKNLLTAITEQPRPQNRTYVERASSYSYPVRCMHCAEAPCALACPSNAIKIDAKTGVVLLNEDKCIGCMTCAMVCPFGAIVMHKSNRVALKCDLCVDRQTRGLIPACVEACPTRVLVYAEEDELLKTGRTAAAVKIINAAGEFKQNTTADSPLDRLRKLGGR